MTGNPKPQASPGVGVDAYGGGIVDPTQNVKDLTEAANLRQDDLRELNDRRIDAEVRRVETQLRAIEREMTVRAEYEEKLRQNHQDYTDSLRHAESDRVNAIRQVDREEVAKTAAANNQAISTLATTTNTIAETLRKTYETTTAELTKRLSAVELQMSEGKGKQTVADPMQAEMFAKLERVLTTVTSGTGQSLGAKNLWAIIIGALFLFLAIAGFMLNYARQ